MARGNKGKETSLSFEVTPALMAFRQLAGDANRFLNTQLVALETLKTATPVRPIDLVLPWTLPAVEAEWVDTRNFTLRGTMISVVDGLDQYLRFSHGFAASSLTICTTICMAAVALTSIGAPHCRKGSRRYVIAIPT